jgi:hypothetical protein
MYVWLRETQRLGTVDLATGAATPRGPIGALGTIGGLALDSRDRAYVAANGATGTLDSVDTKTGATTPGPALRGAPYANGINALAMSRSGELFAINTNMGAPALTALVKIDPKTGVVTKVGPLPNDSDALAFAAGRGSGAAFLSTPNALLFAGLVVVLGIAVALFARFRRK